MVAKRQTRLVEAAPESHGRRLSYGRLEDLLGFHVRMAQTAIYRDFAATIGERGLTQKQLAVLELVAANPAVSQVDLAAALGTDRATMMGLVDRLEERELVRRRPSTIDRRRQELALTPAGEAELAAVRDLVAGHEARILGRLSQSEADRLVRALKRIYAV